MPLLSKTTRVGNTLASRTRAEIGSSSPTAKVACLPLTSITAVPSSGSLPARVPTNFRSSCVSRAPFSIPSGTASGTSCLSSTGSEPAATPNNPRPSIPSSATSSAPTRVVAGVAGLIIAAGIGLIFEAGQNAKMRAEALKAAQQATNTITSF